MNTEARHEVSPRMTALQQTGAHILRKLQQTPQPAGSKLVLRIETPAQRGLDGTPEWTPAELEMLQGALRKNFRDLAITCLNKTSASTVDTKTSPPVSQGTEEVKALSPSEEFDPNDLVSDWGPVAKDHKLSQDYLPEVEAKPSAVDLARAQLLPGHDEQKDTYVPYRGKDRQTEKPQNDPSTHAQLTLEAFMKGQRKLRQENAN